MREAGADKNMSHSIPFHGWTFLDGRRDPCQDYFQSRSGIYYRRPLISPSLSDNDRAGEASGDLHLNLPLGGVRQPLRMHSRHFMLLSLPGDVVCSARGQNDSVYRKHGVSLFRCITPFHSRSIRPGSISCFLFVTVLRVRL